ncbi:MAG: hypothetical protein WA941_00975 [Nitrososphaeraceae archaeon]
MRAVLMVTLLSSLVTVTLFTQGVGASVLKDCESANADCTVAELREWCRAAYPGNEAGWRMCMSQTPTPGTGP